MHDLYEKAPPTRHELLQLREQEANVKTGFEILKNKDDILVKEFFSRAKDLHSRRDEFNSCIRGAYASLVLAEEIHGVIGTRYLACAAKPANLPKISERKVAGVVLPKIELEVEKRNAFTRGYSPSATSHELECAASLFEEALGKAVSVGESEACVKKLGAEVLKARRRSRALEQEIMPEIRKEIHDIKDAMDMRSRESFVRTKRIKAMN